MTDRFSYFDFVVLIVPGALLLWLALVASGQREILMNTQNAAVDALVFLVLSFVSGAALQQLSKYTTEFLVKRAFWHGTLYSKLYLVREYNLCAEPLRTRILQAAKTQFSYLDDVLATLDKNTTSSQSPSPYDVSHQIYRTFDNYTRDHDLAKKGHLANAMYGLYRSLTLTCALAGVVLTFQALWPTLSLGNNTLIPGLISLVAGVLFFVRTREAGERYIQGVLSSVTPKDGVPNENTTIGLGTC